MSRAGARNLAAIEFEPDQQDEDDARLSLALADDAKEESENDGGASAAEPKMRKRRPQFGLPARVICGVVGAILVVASFGMPIWVTKLKAPQYPNGLELTAYGNRVTGDVFEVDTLNHYVGMRPFHFEDVPEAKLWPLAILLGLAAVGVSTVAGRTWIGRLSRFYLWLMPVGVLLDVQYRLYYYGHHLNPGAALRMKPFTPLVVGPTKVWNFTAWSMPGTALLSILAAGVVLSFGPKLMDRLIAKVPRESKTSERAAEEAV